MSVEELKTLKRKRRLTEEERNNYKERWKASGLSKSAFCRQEGLLISTFASWFDKIKKASRLQDLEEKFVPVLLDSSDLASLPTSEKPLKIQLSNGLLIEGSFKKEEVASWLREVSHGLSSLY